MRLQRPGSLMVALVVLIIGAAFVTQLIPYRQIIETNRQVEDARNQLAALEADNAVLEADVEALKTPAEVERLAREKLGYARPGETAYVVLDAPGDESTVAQPEPEPAVERTWVEQIWDFISGGDQQTVN